MTDAPSDEVPLGAAATAAAHVAEAPAQLAEPSPAPPGAPAHPFTLAIDVGGTGIKASVLDAAGRMVADRVRVDTKYPLSADDFVDTVVSLVRPLPAYERVSIGFPGVVRQGHIITAPHFVTKKGPGSKVVPELVKGWSGFDAETVLSERLQRPVRILNDADLQGMAVVAGKGLELVVTLGTGVGTALFSDGSLAPHLELAHHPLKGEQTYNDRLGEAAFERIGPKRWRKRVLEAIATLSGLFNYDHCYIGGGNSRHLTGYVDPSVHIVDNVAGILGGIRLWEPTPEGSPPAA